MPEKISPTSDLSSAFRTPVRGVFVAEDVQEREDTFDLPRSMEFFWNPVELRVRGAASWARIAVPGLSHEVLQWSHNPSREINFTLEWDAVEAANRVGGGKTVPARDPEARLTLSRSLRANTDAAAFVYRDFLYGLLVPVSAGRAPTRTTFVWPGTLQMLGVVTEMEVTFTMFGLLGEPTAFSAEVTMVELRTTFMSRAGATGFFDTNTLAAQGFGAFDRSRVALIEGGDV
jgi:hypothetical protein